MSDEVSTPSPSEHPSIPAPPGKWDHQKPWRFKKGQKPPPRRHDNDVRVIAQQFTHEAIALLVNKMRHAKKEEVQVDAARTLLDRGWGRPAQSVNLSGAIGLLTHEDALARLALEGNVIEGELGPQLRGPLRAEVPQDPQQVRGDPAAPAEQRPEVSPSEAGGAT